MLDRSTVLQSVYHAIDAANEQLPPQDAISKTPTALLYGGSGPLDSLGLVSLVFALENRIETDFGHTLSLMAESTTAANASGNDPFRTVETLVDWLVILLPACKAAA